LAISYVINVLQGNREQESLVSLRQRDITINFFPGEYRYYHHLIWATNGESKEIKNFSIMQKKNVKQFQDTIRK